MAHLAAQHVDSGHVATRQVTAPSLLEPVALERSIVTAGEDLGRVDEDVRLLENVIEISEHGRDRPTYATTCTSPVSGDT